jgi:hypothetical protein
MSNELKEAHNDMLKEELKKDHMENERKMKKQERGKDQEIICVLGKQQVFIRERKPERGPWPSE